MKHLYLGNEAVARGLYEAGVRVVSAYPGTPSTEITEAAVKYPEIYCEWAPNEKVATETACGASIGGARSFCAMKHVGLNVAADPLFTMSYIGVNGGMVLAVADDPGMHSSQNEQDSRNYARAAKVPMVEPADSKECRDFTKLAYELSEQFDTPVILRLTTRIAHSRSIVEDGERKELPLKEYKKDPAKNVMLPAFARPKHEKVEARTRTLVAYAETTSLNKIEDNGAKIGVIAAGTPYQYVKEAMGDTVNYLKLGLVWPLPEQLIRDFAAKCEKVYVVEELDDFIETHCKALGVEVTGKALFPHLPHCVRSGTDCLRLQRLRGITGGHLAGNHILQIRLQIHLTADEKSLLSGSHRQAALIGRGSLAPLQGQHRNPRLLLRLPGRRHCHLLSLAKTIRQL